MNNVEIAAVFDQVADLLEFQAANPFRVRAYRNGARVIRELSESAAGILADPDRKLTDIAGIGADLAGKVQTLVESGSLPMLEELLQQVPASVLAMLRAGPSPSRAAAIYHELHANLEERRGLRAHRSAEGFGEKPKRRSSMVWTSPSSRSSASIGPRPIRLPPRSANTCAPHGDRPEEFAGSYRAARTPWAIWTSLSWRAIRRPLWIGSPHPSLGQILFVRGSTKMSVRLATGFQICGPCPPSRSEPPQYFTAPKSTTWFCGNGQDKGLKVNEYGVFRGEKPIAAARRKRSTPRWDCP